MGLLSLFLAGCSGPPAAALFRIAAGGRQTAEPGVAVPVAPEVQASGPAGEPLAGVPVTFTVTAGGGSVARSSTTTDAAGRASCGAWILGNDKGYNALSASVAGLAPVVFEAGAVATSPEVTLYVASPQWNTLVGDSLAFVVNVTSTGPLASVAATAAAGHSVVLVPTAGQGWTGGLSLEGLPRGQLSVLITATDVAGHVSDALVTVTHDRPPVLVVAAPRELAVARPTVPVDITCSDDDPAGCGEIRLSTNFDGFLMNVTAPFVGEIDLSRYEGSEVQLEIRAKDSIGQGAGLVRNIFVESSPHLRLIAEMSDWVWDVAGTRVVAPDNSHRPVLRVLDTATGTLETLAESDQAFPAGYLAGYLTPTGAIFEGNDNVAPFCSIFDARGGVLTNLSPDGCSLFKKGDFAVYQLLGDPASLVRRDLLSDTEKIVSDVGQNGAVGPNGDVVYELSGQIHRWRAGVDTQLTHDEPPVRNEWPITDGSNVVYFKRADQSAPAGQIVVNDGSKETLLGPAPRHAIPRSEYLAEGGFVAYTSTQGDPRSQVWRHGPSADEKLTFFGTTDSAVEALAPDGTILIGANGRRFLAAPGRPLLDLSSRYGQGIYRDGRFLILLGYSVFEVEP